MHFAFRPVGVEQACDVGRQIDQLTDGPLSTPGGSTENQVRHPEKEGQEAGGEVHLRRHGGQHGQRGERIARGPTTGDFAPRADQQRNNQDDRADGGGELGDQCVGTQDAADPRCGEEDSAAHGDQQAAFESDGVGAEVVAEGVGLD